MHVVDDQLIVFDPKESQVDFFFHGMKQKGKDIRYTVIHRYKIKKTQVIHFTGYKNLSDWLLITFMMI